MYYLNVLKDYTLGYVEVKCCYSKCNRPLKISRNSLQPGLYTCRMGCSLAAYNEEHEKK